MNNSNPFVPQGSLLEQKNKKRARVKVAVYSIFACNILLISPLLIQGCKKEAPTDASTLTSSTDTNTPDTNALPPLPEATNSAPLAQVTNAPAPVPAPVPVPPPVADVPAAKEYVVAKGDSYYSIAKKFGLKIKEVEAANPGVTPTKLKVGQKLQIPAGGGASTASNSTTASDGSDIYVVKSGDSLTKIAKDHGITVKALRTANDLKTDKIKVGQKMKVPSKAAPVDNSAAPVTPASATSAPATTPIPSAPGH